VVTERGASRARVRRPSQANSQKGILITILQTQRGARDSKDSATIIILHRLQGHMATMPGDHRLLHNPIAVVQITTTKGIGRVPTIIRELKLTTHKEHGLSRVPVNNKQVASIRGAGQQMEPIARLETKDQRRDLVFGHIVHDSKQYIDISVAPLLLAYSYSSSCSVQRTSSNVCTCTFRFFSLSRFFPFSISRIPVQHFRIIVMCIFYYSTCCSK
jgi:hypothetical protein